MSSFDDEFIPEDLGEEFEFSQMLRAQPLGDVPVRKDHVLYECGYAAGLATAAKKDRAKKLFWQSSTVAASLIACMSWFAHFYSSDKELRVVSSENVEPNRWVRVIEIVDGPVESVWRPTTVLYEVPFEPSVKDFLPTDRGENLSVDRSWRPGDVEHLFGGGV